jgi:DNA topoisomerase VI subunit A
MTNVSAVVATGVAEADIGVKNSQISEKQVDDNIEAQRDGRANSWWDHASWTDQQKLLFKLDFFILLGINPPNFIT